MKSPALLIPAVLAASGAVAAERIEPTWESIDRRPTPAWFEDAKLGIFIHWGVYAVPAFAPRTEVGVYARYSEWYWKRLATPDIEGHREFKEFHDRVYGPETRYQDFAPQWKAEMSTPGNGRTSSPGRGPGTSSSPASITTASACGRAGRAGTGTPWTWGRTATWRGTS